MTRTKLENTLNEKGISIGTLAIELKVSPESIYAVLQGRITSRRIEAVLEEIFGMPIDDIRRAWRTPNTDHLDLGPIVDRANKKFGRKIA